jgi:hypothetical protein
MKLTDKHVGEEWPNKQIEAKSYIVKLFDYGRYLQDDLNAILELKQRRAEDRQREYNETHKG